MNKDMAKMIAELLNAYDDVENDLHGYSETLDKLFLVLDEINEYLEQYEDTEDNQLYQNMTSRDKLS